MAMFEQWFEQDLAEKVEVRHCEGVVFTGDAESNLVGVRVFKRGEPFQDDTLTVGASIIRADGTTVEADGTLSYNSASIEIPAAALAIEGPIAVHIYLTDGDEMRATVFAGVFTVVATSTESIIDPGTIIPSINALIAELQEKIVYLDRLENFAVTVTTLTPGSSATASVTQTTDTTTLALGIPQGAKGDTGNTGATGPVAAFSIGTVTTLAAGADATATITGTDAAPVLNLGIPQGIQGETGPAGPSVSIDDSTTALSTTWSSSKINTSIHGLIDDSTTSTGSTWSSARIQGQIDDTDTTSIKTWSSEKIADGLDGKMDAGLIQYDTTPCNHLIIGNICIAWGTATAYKNAALFTNIYAGLFASVPNVTASWFTTDASLNTESYGAIRIGAVTVNGFNTKTGSSYPTEAKPIAWQAIGLAATQAEQSGGEGE